MLVYKFLTRTDAIDDLRHRRLKISVLSDLNDPFELLSTELRSRGHRQVFSSFRDDFATRYGILSFSRSWQNPLLWSHYAEKHKGICLGFYVPRDSNSLMPISYTGRRLVGIVERVIDRHKFDEAAMRRVLRTKFEDWRYEKEARIFTRLEDRDATTGLYFADFQPKLRLQQVILGPRFAESTQELLELIKGFGKQVSIIQSRLAFRSFRVIRNRAVRFAV